MDIPICTAIIEQLPDGVAVLDAAGSIVAINPAARSMTGLPAGDLAGRSATEIFAAVPGLNAALQQAEQREQELKIPHRDGDRYITMSMRPLHDAESGTSGCLLVFRDTSEQKSVEKEYMHLTAVHNAELSNTSEQLMQQLAEQAQLEQQLLQTRKMDAIGRLTTGVAHDFNNLLAAILGSAELGLQQTVSDHLLHQHFLDIKYGALIARDLTSQLLHFGHREKPKRKHVSLNHIISDLLNMIGPILGEDINLKVQLAPALYPAFADPDQMRQLIVNLCANARDTMPDGGELTLSTENLSYAAGREHIPDIDQESSYIVITITNNGEEPADGTEQHLFDSVYASPENGKTAGLGLTIVEGIINQHQGYLTVNTLANRGHTVKVYLPAIPDMGLVINRMENEKTLTGGSETILLVEDNEMVLNVAKRLLADLGYSVLIAHDADEAMDLFRQNMDRIDLVMSDVVMPRSSGPEMYSRIHSMKPNLPALFVTGYDVNQSIDTLAMLECEQYCAVLQKPYSQDALAEKIRFLLDRPD